MTVLQGKVAFVTGGSRGIGRAIAIKMAKYGAHVAITYAKSNSEAERVIEEIRAQGVKGLSIQADANDPQKVVNAVHKAVLELGAIEILINNAGIFDLASIMKLTLEDFDRFININVKAVFAATMASVQTMPDGGRIITIGSINGDVIPFSGGSLYAMSKAAVKMMTKGWARDLGKKKYRQYYSTWTY